MAAPSPRPKLHIPEHATTEKVSSWARLAPASAISFAALQAKRAAAAEAERVAAEEQAAAARVEAAEALCTQLRALEPEASAPTIDTASPPFPRLGVSLALLHLFATLVPKGTTTAEACFGFFMTLTARAWSHGSESQYRMLTFCRHVICRSTKQPSARLYMMFRSSLSGFRTHPDVQFERTQLPPSSVDMYVA